MSKTSDDNPHPLIAAGWRPGVLFAASGVSYEQNVREPETGFASARARGLKTGERLVVISHQCDIKAADEKYLEALICKQYAPDNRLLARWDKNSPSYFIVDPEVAFVAISTHRVKIQKESLYGLNHDGLKMDDERLLRFVEWLARRYDRPTVPDAVYDSFHNFAYAALQQALDNNPRVLGDFNRAVHDVRITLPLEANPPFEIGVVYLTKNALTEPELDSIYFVHDLFVNASPVSTHVQDPVILPLDEAPYGLILRTQPLIFEYPSFSDTDAATPLWLLEKDKDQ